MMHNNMFMETEIKYQCLHCFLYCHCRQARPLFKSISVNTFNIYRYLVLYQQRLYQCMCPLPVNKVNSSSVLLLLFKILLYSQRVFYSVTVTRLLRSCDVTPNGLRSHLQVTDKI